MIADVLGVCADCIKNNYESALPYIQRAHAESRQSFNLPADIPRREDGVSCFLCANECQLGEGEYGYCGLRIAERGKIRHLAGTSSKGLLHWYRDALPTNCVADWVCQGSQQRGYHNLAVFYASCTANCLFCQNWSFREVRPGKAATTTARELAEVANARTFCVCFFGGDPSSQMPHALAAARMLAEQGVRICWETNGLAHPKLMDAAMEYAFVSGGCVKFDLKAYNDNVNRALTGVSNRMTLENFSRAASRAKDRPEPPLVIASTLLIPGYVESEEVADIAAFIASIDADIPYALLAFAPNFYLPDLSCTTTQHAQAALNAALETGLRNVRLGNRHLLDW